MSDTGGGGAGAGQDEGADNERPHPEPSLPCHGVSEVRETSDEGAPPSAKRTKVSIDEPVKETVEMCGETLEETGSCLQEDGSSFEQSMYSCSNIKKKKNAQFESEGFVFWTS